jgi:hypothetical protein
MTARFSLSRRIKRAVIDVIDRAYSRSYVSVVFLILPASRDFLNTFDRFKNIWK